MLLKQIFRPWFVVAIVLFVSHQISQKILHIRLDLLDNYLDPLLLMPLLLHAILWERRLVFGFDEHHILPKIIIFLVWLLVSVLAEFIFPILNKGFTTDFVDIFLYGIGSIVFVKFFNLPARKLQ